MNNNFSLVEDFFKLLKQKFPFLVTKEPFKMTDTENYKGQQLLNKLLNCYQHDILEEQEISKLCFVITHAKYDKKVILTYIDKDNIDTWNNLVSEPPYTEEFSIV